MFFAALYQRLKVLLERVRLDRNSRTEAWTSVALKEVSYLCLGEKKIFMLTGVAWTCQLYYRTFIFSLRARYGMKVERFTSALVP